jgi:hypothetical protein
MIARRNLALLAALAIAIPAAHAVAARTDPGAPGPVSGTIVMTAKAAALGVGYTWGDGVLRFHGRSYHFDVKGVTVADVGYAQIQSRGRVYGLHKVSDFSGTYGASTGEATLGNGIGGQYLRNGNGVEIRVDETTKGARLAGSADGIQLTLHP